MIKNILLISPPFPMLERYCKSFRSVGTLTPKLGMLYIASALESAGYKVQFLDSVLEGHDIDEALNEIVKISPDIIGITTETPNMKRSALFSEKIKDSLNIPIVFGGPHPTLLPEEVLSHNSIDYVVIGEGEYSIVELVNALNCGSPVEQFSKINGIGYKNNGKVIITEQSERIRDLDNLKFPAYHCIDINRYRPTPHQYRRLPVASMVTSRGCPFSCTFCSSSEMFKRKYIIRSVDNVIEEIIYLKERFGVKEITFWDDIWGLSKRWVEDFCNKLVKEKIDITWSCSCRADTVSERMLLQMAKAGCWRIFYGLESLDSDILKAINKGIKLEGIYDSVSWTKKAGIEVHGNFILGLPMETPEKARKMVKNICKIPFDYVKFNVLTPYPGTVLYRELNDGKWGTYRENHDKLTLHHVTFTPYGYSSFDELDKLRRWATKQFYIRPQYIFNRIMSMRTVEDLKRNVRGFKAVAGL
jgi:magnesium-protoporphyrin IX monomethyl ester (oxidative) cyclase|tara:strand:+ start:286 stop:1704 length:1419 start_codon:yes stop_codon:yes gene_type:complete